LHSRSQRFLLLAEMSIGDFLFGAVAFAWITAAASALWHLRWARRLPALAELLDSVAAKAPSAETKHWRVSVVLAARNEAGRIENTVRRLLAQRDVELEIIVVDDRSSDGSDEILRRLAEKDARLRVLRIETLPEGWLGKCHACHLGAAAATGDWILFIDADCWLKPDVLLRTLLVGESEQAGHVTLAPSVPRERISGQAFHLAFAITVANMMSAANRDRPRAYVGIGAFNLVRAEAYRTCGGYEALRLTVVDDMKLGLLLRRAGQRTRAFFAGDDLECHWGATAWQVARLLEKNYFAVLDYRLWLAAPFVACGMLAWMLALIGPFTGTVAGLAAGAGFMSLSLPAMVQARRLGWSLTLAPLAPLVFGLMFYAMANSIIVTLRQGGVRWRDTFYSLGDLRGGNVR
jgi:hypothetical protein